MRYLAFLGAILLGYAFAGKSFAYIGFYPLYIGEVALAAGLGLLFFGALNSAILRSPITWALLVYGAWGAFITLLSVGVYGLDALRDSVVWLYSIFALVVSGILLRTNMIERPLDWAGRWIPIFVVWVPIVYIGRNFVEMPNMPGTEWPILKMKAADLAANLGGAAAFLALGLHQWYPGKTNRKISPVGDHWLWAAIFAGTLALGSRQRGALITIVVALLFVCMIKPANRIVWILPSMGGLFLLFIASDISIPVGAGRSLSPDQLFQNIGSVFGYGPEIYGLQATLDWRISWWEHILDYTVFGEYFWTGKGFGLNLSIDDGFVTVGGANRSPHNAHMTILARSGVPGLVLWVILQATVLVKLLSGFFRTTRAGYRILACVNVWLLAYWAAFIVNMSSEVYLESPYGGIWYWCLIGYIIALTLYQDDLLKRAVPANVSGVLVH